MFKYVLKRVVIFIPTLILISILTFALSKMAPGDPVKLALGNTEQSGESGGSGEKMAGEKAYRAMAEQLGLTLPTFYFDFSNVAMPDTLYRMVKKGERDNLERLISMYGNWPQIEAYFHSIKQLEFALLDTKQDSTTYAPGRIIRENTGRLLLEYKDRNVARYVAEITEASKQSPNFNNVRIAAEKLAANYAAVKAKATPGKNNIPAIHWYGTKNQYHRWLTNFLSFDFGISYVDKRPVWSKIKEAMPWTLLVNVIVIFLSYILAVPLGIASARNKDSIPDRITTFILFIFYSLPTFWIATMLVIFTTTDEYGMNWFPTFGLGDVTPDMNALEVFSERGFHLLLPLFCLIPGRLAYLSRQMRGAVLSIFRMDYIRTARAKGLSEEKVVWVHAFRNSLIPLITLFAGIFPAAISGSFIIEIIFSIPGMGQVAYAALVARDYPMVFTVMMFSAFLTLIGTLVADIMYALVDPRISYK
jgi:peptide/nickel transport system permease protein